MSKRGPKPKGGLNFLGQLNPEILREIFAVVLLILGIMGLLAIVSAGGRFGENIKDGLVAGFGIVGYFFPFIFLFWGAYLFLPEKMAPGRRYAWGILVAFLLLAGLFNPYGGRFGEVSSMHLNNLLGTIGTYIVLIGILAIDLLITFSFSLKEIFSKVRVPRLAKSKEGPAVSVFSTVRRQVELPGLETWEPLQLDLLENPSGKATSGNIAKNVELIQKTLTDFSIEVSMGDVNVGPTVTQFELKPAEGIKLNQITARSDDLALALAAHPVRVEAPIPGKSAVGVEVPNKVPVTVTLREVLETEVFKNRKSNLSLALGRDVAGNPVVVDLKRMPHLLIAGATGSGKSVAINAMMTTLMYQNSPAELRLLLVDPKRVEFTPFNGIPYLLAPVVTEVDKTINLLKWAVAEMDRRFQVFSQNGSRNIDTYNETATKRGSTDAENQPMPYIVIFIDELADLMAQAANEVEAAIVRLAQLARATGIHLVVATQRPSVDVITGLIKANITARIAFAVASQVDSRTILDQAGSEKLLGNGDMLFLSPDTGKPRRVQGVMLSDKEIGAVTNFLKKSGETFYDPSIVEFRTEGVGYTGGGGEVDDSLYEDALQLVVQAGKASASLLQRRLKVGYARAARLLDILEENGVIGPADGAKPRDVLIDTLELDSRRQHKDKPRPQSFPEPLYYRFQRPAELEPSKDETHRPATAEVRSAAEPDSKSSPVSYEPPQKIPTEAAPKPEHQPAQPEPHQLPEAPHQERPPSSAPPAESQQPNQSESKSNQES